MHLSSAAVACNHLQPQLAYSDERIAAVTATDERVRRLQSVPNVAPVTAADFVAAIDEASRFRRGHEVQAYLGLVPRELSSRPSARSPKRAWRAHYAVVAVPTRQSSDLLLLCGHGRHVVSSLVSVPMGTPSPVVRATGF